MPVTWIRMYPYFKLSLQGILGLFYYVCLICGIWSDLGIFPTQDMISGNHIHPQLLSKKDYSLFYHQMPRLWFYSPKVSNGVTLEADLTLNLINEGHLEDAPWSIYNIFQGCFWNYQLTLLCTDPHFTSDNIFAVVVLKVASWCPPLSIYTSTV